jgi:hypothetical protein
VRTVESLNKGGNNVAIGQVPIRERLVLPRREGVPLAHVFTGAAAFPVGTTADLYLYDALENEIAFWPLDVDGADVTVDVEDWWTYRLDARSFSVFITYPDALSKRYAWFEGAVVRTY